MYYLLCVDRASDRKIPEGELDVGGSGVCFVEEYSKDAVAGLIHSHRIWVISVGKTAKH